METAHGEDAASPMRPQTDDDSRASTCPVWSPGTGRTPSIHMALLPMHTHTLDGHQMRDQQSHLALGTDHNLAIFPMALVLRQIVGSIEGRWLWLASKRATGALI
jgi:hypothetical protein